MSGGLGGIAACSERVCPDHTSRKFPLDFPMVKMLSEANALSRTPTFPDRSCRATKRAYSHLSPLLTRPVTTVPGSSPGNSFEESVNTSLCSSGTYRSGSTPADLLSRSQFSAFIGTLDGLPSSLSSPTNSK